MHGKRTGFASFIAIISKPAGRYHFTQTPAQEFQPDGLGRSSTR